MLYFDHTRIRAMIRGALATGPEMSVAVLEPFAHSNGNTFSANEIHIPALLRVGNCDDAERKQETLSTSSMANYTQDASCPPDRYAT